MEKLKNEMKMSLLRPKISRAHVWVSHRVLGGFGFGFGVYA